MIASLLFSVANIDRIEFSADWHRQIVAIGLTLCLLVIMESILPTITVISKLIDDELTLSQIINWLNLVD